MITKVIGLGNIWAGDDGVGIHVINELQKMCPPPEVELIDGGSCGLGLLSLMEGADKVIIVDAIMLCGQTPGSLIKLSPRQFRQKQEASSSHYLSLSQTLELAKILGYKSDVLLVGVTPETMDFSTCLSPRVQAAIPQVLETIFNELTITTSGCFNKKLSG